MNLEIIGRQLSAYGMKIHGVSDGFAAIAELERSWHKGRPMDLVFLDQMMRVFPARELAERLRAMPALRRDQRAGLDIVGRCARFEQIGGRRCWTRSWKSRSGSRICWTAC